jgi:hypothetical protein
LAGYIQKTTAGFWRVDYPEGQGGNWRAQLDLYLLPELGNARLDRIAVGVIENLQDELRAKLSAKSVNAY